MYIDLIAIYFVPEDISIIYICASKMLFSFVLQTIYQKMNVSEEFRQSKINWQVLKQVFLQGKKSYIYPPQPILNDVSISSNMFSLQQLSELIKPIIEEINSIYQEKMQQLMIMKNIELQVLDKKIGILENEIIFLKRQKICEGSRIMKNMSSRVQTKIDEQQQQHKSFIYIQQNQHEEEEQSLLQPQTQQKRPIMPASNNKTIFKDVAKLSNFLNSNKRKLFHYSSERFKENEQERQIQQTIPESARFFQQQTKLLKQELTGLRIAIQKIHNVKVPQQETCQSIITSPRPAVRNILNISSNHKLEHLSNQNKHLRSINDQLLMKLLQVQQQLQSIKFILIESLQFENEIQQQMQ